MKAHTLMPRAPSCLVTAALALALAGLAVIPGEAIAASSPWTARSAPGGPGGTSYLDLGRKDCLGSATTNRYVVSAAAATHAGATGHVQQSETVS